jgi:ABC-type siderophore export system fused ATPase/permease subunit
MNTKSNVQGMRVAALLVILFAIVIIGQLVNVWWMAITAILSCAVWMIIWLWPEGVAEKVGGKSSQTPHRTRRKK